MRAFRRAAATAVDSPVPLAFALPGRTSTHGPFRPTRTARRVCGGRPGGAPDVGTGPADWDPPAGVRQGENDFGNVGYDGPDPPSEHRYRFKLYAGERPPLDRLVRSRERPVNLNLVATDSEASGTECHSH
ncbi:hypothetical protein BRC81_02660 [Halobacteriales archaeon QS_1_68_20]|nr:MAG: hypothetical protein BRC81_02660 [Halobacteriales archaeon QS_1_68_20]